MSDKTKYIVRYKGEIVGTRKSKCDYPFAVVTTGYTENGRQLEIKRLEQSVETMQHWIEKIESGEDEPSDPEAKIEEYKARIASNRATLEAFEDGTYEFEPGILGYSSRRELAMKKKREFADTYHSVIVETETE